MLKVTTRQEVESITLIVEGRLAGPWVQELENCWSVVSEHGRAGVVVNLTGVTFVDQFGQELLRRMWRDGAELKASGCMNKCLVDQITA